MIDFSKTANEAYMNIKEWIQKNTEMSLQNIKDNIGKNKANEED